MDPLPSSGLTPESQTPYGAEPPTSIEQNKEARTMGMLCHLLGIPLGFVGPLISWLIKKDEMPFVNDQGKESLNFQLSVLIAVLIVGVPTCGFGVPIVGIAALVFCIMATVKANNGEYYRYPLTLRMVK